MKKHNIFIAFFIAVILFSSCDEKNLEHNPSDKLAEEYVLDTKTSIEGVLNGMYYILQDRLYNMEIPFTNELLADDVLISEDSWWSAYKSIHTHNIQTVTFVTRYAWNHAYLAIDAANVLINDPLEALTDIERKDIKAQAAAVRAMVYLDLIGLYARPVFGNADSPGVLLITKSEHGKSHPRSSVKEVYAQIKKDLDFALANIQKSTNDATRVNEPYVNGLFARYYLNLRKYEEAYAHASKVVDAVPLMSREELRHGLSNEPSEALFTIYSSESNFLEWRNYTSLWEGGYTYSGQGARIYPEVYERFSDNDVRKSFFWESNGWYSWPEYFKTPEKSAQYNMATDTWINYYFMNGKFPRRDFECSDIQAYLKSGDHKYIKERGSVAVGNYTFMRASEMVLVKAECAARNGDYTTAQDELFKIQKRALFDPADSYNDNLTTAVKSTKTGDELVEEILMEKRKELLGEGHRMRDLLRLGKDYTRPASAWTVNKNVSFNSNYIIFPIADTEININDKLDLNDQNPGYK